MDIKINSQNVANIEGERVVQRIAAGALGTKKIEFSFPIVDIQTYWTPSLRHPAWKLGWYIEARSASFSNSPFISFFNLDGQNRMTFGVTCQNDDVIINAKMNQEKCTYDVTIEIAVTEDTKDFDLVIDRRDCNWQQTVADFRQQLIAGDIAFPEEAWKPVYCTWYAVHAEVNEKWVEENAPIAAELGFKTWIIDDGWCFDDMKRVSPSTMPTWYENVGTWEISKAKFPNFDEHVKKMHKLGLKYLLWVAPYLVGTKSNFREKFEDALLPGVHEGCQRVEVRRKDALDDMKNRLVSLMKNHDIDGLKIDFLDDPPVSMETPRGQKAIAFVKSVTDDMRAVKKDALVEFRQSYATPAMMPYATQFRAGDVPFDFIDNFQEIVQIRMIMGDHVPVHADPMYWAKNELPSNIARHFIAAIAGVPMLSMDLVNLTEMERKITTFWLKFYDEHIPFFQAAHWTCSNTIGHYAFLKATLGNEDVLFLADKNYLPVELKPGRRCTVLNLTSSAIAVDGIDHAWNPDGTPAIGEIPSGGGAVMKG